MRYRVLFLTFLCLLIACGSARAQQQPSGQEPSVKTCSHGGYELWDGLRMLPVQFTYFDGNTAFWKYQDVYVVKLGAFVFDEGAQYISREKKKVDMLYLIERKDSEWLCYYCSHCHALLRAYELKAGPPSIE